MYLSILSRVLLSSHDVFTRVLTTLAQVHNETDEAVLGKILTVWLSKMPMVSQLEQRKLLGTTPSQRLSLRCPVAGLALTNLLTTQSRPVFERFGTVMVNILECLNDMEDSLLVTDGRSPTSYEDTDGYETDHDQRKKQLILSDPVHTIVLKDYLQSQVSLDRSRYECLNFCLQMYELRNQIGLPHYEQLLQTVDADSISQLKGYITL
jgi:hypothetical protein